MDNPDTRLRSFLHNAVADAKNLRALPARKQASPDLILDDLRRFLGLISVPVSQDLSPVENYLLVYGNDGVHGPVLVRAEPSLLREDRYRLLCLLTGEEFIWNRHEVQSLTETRIFIEQFKFDTAPTVRSMVQYTYGPLRRYVRQVLFFKTLVSFLASALFVINFNVLLHAMPARAHEALVSLGVLVTLVIVVMVVADVILAHAQLFVDSIVTERRRVLGLSLMGGLSPMAISQLGPSRVVAMVNMFTATSGAYYEAMVIATSLIASLPALVLMFFRLPTGIFTFVIFMAVVSIATNAFYQLKFHRTRQAIALREDKTRDDLFKIIAFSARIKFYRQVGVYLARWVSEETYHVRDHYEVSKQENAVSVALEWLSKATQIAGMLTVTLLVSRADHNNSDFNLATAFIILFTIGSLYSFAPRIADLMVKLGAVRIDLEIVAPLVRDLSTGSPKTLTNLSGSEVCVSFEDVQLPYGCQFQGKSPLSLEVTGARVIQVIGESGSGKSTFLKCLLGVQAPKNGSIKVMNCPVMELGSSDRQRLFAFVSQSVQLIPGSLRDNLMLFAPAGANDRDVWAALEVVCLHEQIRGLPLGLGTPIADARRGFSTGERQRLILAQALLKKSSILVLDEAMSGLPVGLERLIFERLKQTFTQMYIVSHRTHVTSLVDLTIKLERVGQPDYG